jgi:hypothetical protein
MVIAEAVKRRLWDLDLLAEFAPSVEANPWGFGRAAEVLDGAQAFEYRHAGQRALVAVRPVHRLDGTRLDVVGLVSTGDRLQAFAFDAAMHQIATECQAQALAMTTQRQHIANVAHRTGWKQTGVLMIKNLGKTQ